MVEIERVDDATAELAITPSAPNTELLEKLSVSPDARDTVEVVGDFSTAAEFSDLHEKHGITDINCLYGQAKRGQNIRQLGRHFNAVVEMVSELYFDGLERLIGFESDPLVLQNIAEEAYSFKHHVEKAASICPDIVQPLIVERALDIHETAERLMLEELDTANATLVISQSAPNAELLEKLPVTSDARYTEVVVVGNFSTAADKSRAMSGDTTINMAEPSVSAPAESTATVPMCGGCTLNPIMANGLGLVAFWCKDCDAIWRSPPITNCPIERAKREHDIRQLGRHFNAVVEMVSDLYFDGLEHLMRCESSPLVLQHISEEAYSFKHHVCEAASICPDIVQPLIVERAQDIHETAERLMLEELDAGGDFKRF